MAAKLLHNPPPNVWRRFGSNFHQDWAMIAAGKFSDLSAALDAEVRNLPEKDKFELSQLVDELLRQKPTNGDLRRAWKLARTQIYIDRGLKNWFGVLQSALKNDTGHKHHV